MTNSNTLDAINFISNSNLSDEEKLWIISILRANIKD